MSKVFKFVIDAGHYPHTSGKRSPLNIMREYHFNSEVAIHVMNILKAYDNVECHFVHRDDRDVPLAERVRNANNLKADAYISIHANAHGDGVDFTSASGVETWVGTNASAMSRKMANSLQSKMVKVANQINRGVKEGNLYVVNPKNIKMPAILLEAEFMTNRSGLDLLMSKDYRIKVAYAIVEMLEECFGIKKIHQPTPAPQPAPTPTANIPTSAGVHIVKPSDTLWGIARANKMTVQELKDINNLKSDTIRVGQEIKLRMNSIPQPIPTPQPIHTPQPAPQPKPQPTPVPTSSKLKYARVLKKGMRGEDVRALQKALNSLNFKVGTADGDFGNKTLDAVKRFQKVHLPYEVDGVAGKNTINKINSLLK